MYIRFFHLNRAPFSIAPDPRYLFMSGRHREALAHLLYGVKGGGGFVLLTGEIGAGKTTVCRCFLSRVPAGCNVAYIFNPKLTVIELLQSICDEFHLPTITDTTQPASVKQYVDQLNTYLLATHAQKQNNVLIIDEAQNLSPDVLEQLRLLTNLETNERKLLQIILIGQPELREMLKLPALKQLAQRVIARYHLKPLSEIETLHYIHHRLTVAGAKSVLPFSVRQMRRIHRLTGGVPRRINLLCDRALLGAYVEGKLQVDRHIINNAAKEILPAHGSMSLTQRWRYLAAGAAAAVIVTSAAAWTLSHDKAASSAKAASKTTVTKKITRASSIAALPLAGRHVFDADEREVTLRELAKLWNVDLGSNPACESAPTKTLRCYSEDKIDLDKISELDRPVMFSLYNDAGDRHYAILVSIAKNNAILLINGAKISMPMSELTKRIKGGFTTFWRMSPDFREPIRMGFIGPEVDWVATQLAKQNHSALPMMGQMYGHALIDQVRQFQATHDVKVDGVVGPRTLMYLNRVAGTAEPHLLPAMVSTVVNKE